MQGAWQDLRYAVRSLRRGRVATLVAVLTLGIGIGATTTVFSLVNDLLLRPLPAPDADRLVNVHRVSRDGSGFHSFAYPEYVALRDGNDALTGLAAWGVVPLALNDGGDAQRTLGMLVSGNYFGVLGLRPATGRLLSPEDDRVPGEAAVAVLGYRLWQRRFGGDRAIVGRTVRLNGQPFTVIGVAPRGFTSTLGPVAIDVFVPVMMAERLTTDDRLSANSSWLELIGRLRSGVTRDRAAATLTTIAARLAAVDAQSNRWSSVHVTGTRGVAGEGHVVVGRFLAMLLALAGLVLAIACVNVANILLARATARRREMAIRLAMGAGRVRLVRQLLTETVLLFLGGGAAAALVATWATGLLMAFRPPIDVPLAFDFGIDPRVFAFTVGVSLLSALVFGLAPALQASRPDVAPALKDAQATPPGRLARIGIRNVLVVAQVTVSLVLLVTSGLFLRSLANATAVDPGFRPDNLLVLSFDLRLNGYSAERRVQFFRELGDRVAALPSVTAATFTSSLPLGPGNTVRGFWIPGRSEGPDSGLQRADFAAVAPGYFSTMDIPLRRGREFTARDGTGAPPVVVINETLARLYWPGEDPLGKRLSMYGPGGPYAEIIGVTRDGKYRTLGEDPRPFVYAALLQEPGGAATLVARTAGNPAASLDPVRGLVRALDPGLPVFEARTMREYLGFALLPVRLAGTLLGVFGGIGLLLATVGIYGVTAYSVSRRTREVGVRMALGARPRDVLALVVRQGMTPALIGLAAGVLIALAVTRLLRSLLYGVSPTDALTFVATALLLTGAALAACYVPARRASHVDPMTALRYE